MHETVVKNPITLRLSETHEVVATFKSREALIANWPFIRPLHRKGLIGNAIKIEYTYDEWWMAVRRLRKVEAWPAVKYQYYLRDSFGDVLAADDIASEYRRRHPYRSPWGNWIPGSKRGGGWSSLFRRPHTTQEKRWAKAWDDEEDAPPSRARRTGYHLPDAWDDQVRSCRYNNKNWKRYRKHQWKEKKGKGPKGPFFRYRLRSQLYTWN